MAIDTTERIELLEEMIEHLDRCAEIVRALQSEPLRRRIMAEFEGREGGWLGTFTRDIIEQELADLRSHGDGAEDEENDND